MPKSVDPEQKRGEFVDASCQVIAREGLQAATLRRVAAEAGFTTGSLTHYFADRRALIVSSLRAAHVRAGERMTAAAQRANTPATRLEAVLLEALPLDDVRLCEWRVWLSFWAASMNDQDLAEENDRRYLEWRTLLASLVQQNLPERGEVDSEIPAEIPVEVDQLIALIDGLGLHIARRPSLREDEFEILQSECKATLSHHLRSIRLN